MHLAWRWFTGLGFEQEIPHHSTFSKNRHGRFQESNLFQELFERIVEQCIAAGLVEGEQMSVQGCWSRRLKRRPLLQTSSPLNHQLRTYIGIGTANGGHFNPRNSQDQISKNGRLAYVSQRPSGSAALLLVVTEAKSPSLRKPRRLDWIRAKARFELSMLLVRTKTAGQKGAFAHDDYRM